MSKYIDAKKLLAQLKACRATYKYGDVPSRVIFEMIQAFPAADVEPVKHGEWLNSHHTQIVTCSLCGGTVQTNWRGFYCQNCGAKMDAQEDRAPSPSYRIPTPPRKEGKT